MIPSLDPEFLRARLRRAFARAGRCLWRPDDGDSLLEAVRRADPRARSWTWAWKDGDSWLDEDP